MTEKRDFPPRGAHPAIRPKDAATLILLGGDVGDPKVLMGRRSKDLVFMPGLYVFPGGRLDRADHTAPRAGSLAETDMARLVNGMGARGSRRRAEALALAAVRETWEETGLFVAHAGKDAAPTANGLWKAFAERGYTPDLSGLRYVARAITPPGQKRRFDTRFFAAKAGCVANPQELAANPDEELDDVQWVALSDTASLPLPRITTIMLDLLMRRLSDDPDLVEDLPVPCISFRYGRHVQTME